VTSTALSYGVYLHNTVIDKDKNDRPSGTATAEIDTGEPDSDDSSCDEDESDDPNAIITEQIEMINKKDFGGRIVKVHSMEAISTRHLETSDTRRYFGGHGLPSMKCFGCNQTGHKQQDCPNVISVCHLCAGKDHDPGKRY
jgi:hypothetical protein